MALQRWRTCMEYISNPIQSHDIPLPTSSRGASQVAQPHTTSQIAQPQTTSRVQLPHGSVQRTRSNASHAPSQNSSQPQDEDLIVECEVGIADESGVRNKRGIRRLSDVWNLPPTQRIIVKLNLAFVPVGNEGGVLTRFIGTVARKPHLCPINCNWDEVPLHYKEACWNIIQVRDGCNIWPL